MSIIFVLFLISDHGILSCSFKFNIFLSTALWAVLSLLVVHSETMSGSHKSLLIRHIRPLLVFRVISGVVYRSVFLFFFQNSSTLLFSSSVFEVCGLSEVFKFCHFSSFSEFPDQVAYLDCLHGMLCILSFPCVFLGQLSDFLSSECLNVFSSILFPS